MVPSAAAPPCHVIPEPCIASPCVHALPSHKTSTPGTVSPQAPGRAGDVGAQAAAARRREEREAGGRLRVNAFELIAGSFNVRAASERGLQGRGGAALL